MTPATNPRFVAYYRVSTAGQGRSGLGLEAQQRAIKEYVASVNGSLIAPPFKEIESGKRSDRPELAKALAHAKKNKARLLVAKLDRLARNVAFMSALMESGVDFVACDMPTANRFMVHILSAVAEYEAKMISDRTKAGLASRKARSLPLGTPANLKRGNKVAAEKNRAEALAVAERMRPAIEAIRGDGATSVRAIAAALNAKGYTTDRGSDWHPTSVARLLARLDQ